MCLFEYEATNVAEGIFQRLSLLGSELLYLKLSMFTINFLQMIIQMLLKTIFLILIFCLTNKLRMHLLCRSFLLSYFMIILLKYASLLRFLGIKKVDHFYKISFLCWIKTQWKLFQWFFIWSKRYFMLLMYFDIRPWIFIMN